MHWTHPAPGDGATNIWLITKILVCDVVLRADQYPTGSIWPPRNWEINEWINKWMNDRQWLVFLCTNHATGSRSQTLSFLLRNIFNFQTIKNKIIIIILLFTTFSRKICFYFFLINPDHMKLYFHVNQWTSIDTFRGYWTAFYKKTEATQTFSGQIASNLFLVRNTGVFVILTLMYFFFYPTRSPVMRKFPCSSKASLYLRTTWFKPRSSS